MENLTTFTSSRGVLKSCSAHNPNPVSSSNQLHDAEVHHLPSGSSVYVCTDALRLFSVQKLPLINKPFVLVTGDSDTPITSELLADFDIQRIVNNEYLITWYAQNCLTTHPKLEQLPIGLDYHTMWDHPGHWGMRRQSPVAQEHAILSVLRQSSPFQNRLLGGYCNWHFAIDRGDRRECKEKIQSSIAFFEPHPIPRMATWQRQSQIMFVVSPEGAGVDCHRTWEALLLGCIPVVKRNSLTPLFSDLPVVVLDDWSQFSKDYLLTQASHCLGKKYDFSSLFLSHWVAKIGLKNPTRLPLMDLAEFREFLIGESF